MQGERYLLVDLVEAGFTYFLMEDTGIGVWMLGAVARCWGARARCAAAMAIAAGGPTRPPAAGGVVDSARLKGENLRWKGAGIDASSPMAQALRMQRVRRHAMGRM